MIGVASFERNLPLARGQGEGFAVFVLLALGVLLLPFVLLGSGIAAQLDVDGHSNWAIALDVIVKYSAYVLLNALLVFAVAVPIYLRKRWSSLIELRMG